MYNNNMFQQGPQGRICPGREMQMQQMLFQQQNALQQQLNQIQYLQAQLTGQHNLYNQQLQQTHAVCPKEKENEEVCAVYRAGRCPKLLNLSPQSPTHYHHNAAHSAHTNYQEQQPVEQQEIQEVQEVQEVQPPANETKKEKKARLAREKEAEKARLEAEKAGIAAAPTEAVVPQEGVPLEAPHEEQMQPPIEGQGEIVESKKERKARLAAEKEAAWLAQEVAKEAEREAKRGSS